MANALKKKSFKIEPFKHPVKQDPNYGEKTWKVLESAIHEINNQNASGLSFEELYRNAYNMCINKFGDRLYTGLQDTIKEHLQTIAQRIDAAQGDRFLRELKACWDTHNKSMQMIRDILMYMDRIYVRHQNKTPVHQLGLDLWRDLVIYDASIEGRLRSNLLDFVNRERNGELIDQSLIKSITTMLMDLGPDVYRRVFEDAYLSKATEFFKVEAQEFISSCNCPDYLQRAEHRLQEEAQRVGNYLDPISEPKIKSVVETELILHQMRPLVEMERSGLVPLLQQDQHEDLARMHKLFSRVQGGHDLIRTMMSEHLRKTGRQLVEDPEQNKDPVSFVERLLTEKDKFDAVIKEAFGGDKSFQNMLNSAFEHFINLNQRSPEFISLFMDDRLRKGLKGMNEDDMEKVLDKVMMLFRFLQEKDVFEKYYKQHLAKRLLSGRVVSDDLERSLLVKLKTECGYQFTSKLESMFNDIKTSRDTMADFKGGHAKAMAEQLDIDLYVQVLTTGSWPTSLAPKCALTPELEAACKAFEGALLHCTIGSWPTSPAPKCALTPELEAACKAFEDFYTEAHHGRKLAWQINMGTADVKAGFSGGRRHELNVSSYQMLVLVLFNHADSLPYREIQALTGIPHGDLRRALQSLACVKGKNILKKEPMSKDVNDTDLFSFNDSFTSKLHKVKIGMVSAQKESEPEKTDTRHKVEEDRKPQIEAAIVRIMKARRTLDHHSIVTEVTRQLSSRFMPNPTVIKKRIESLIEREFIERDQTDRKLYRYLA